MALTDELRRGRDNALSSYELARRLDMPQRHVGFLVNNLRQKGILIGSVHRLGYYLIDTQDELEDTIRHIEHRKAGIDRTVSALRKAWAS